MRIFSALSVSRELRGFDDPSDLIYANNRAGYHRFKGGIILSHRTNIGAKNKL